MLTLFSLIRKGFTLFLVFGVKLYQWVISPLTPSSCRHIPSCSSYAIEALQKHGPVHGLWLSLRRLSKCHPWGTYGYDPVPEKRKRIKVKQFRVKN
jgi:uncharacterized protein